MVRLLKERSHYEERYGDSYYGLHLLERLLIREYNRGQDGAGIGVIRLDETGSETFRIRREGPSAVEKISEDIDKEIAFEREWGSERKPFYGSLMLGHVRYSTTGKVGEEYLHPFMHATDKEEDGFMICGNFHLINTQTIAERLKEKGIDIDPSFDTKVLLNDIALAKDDNNGLAKSFEEALEQVAPTWDGGFVICGISNSGDWWAVRDSHGIRPAFWYADDEKVIVASERSAISISAGIDERDIHQLYPGVMIKVDRKGKLSFRRVIEEKAVRECVFERIYFSRADGGEITLEREKLGYYLAEKLKEDMGVKPSETLFSFVPASARSSFLGMVAYFAGLELPVSAQILVGDSNRKYELHSVSDGKGEKVFFGRTIEKGKALRTFISTEQGREELVEKTYIKVLNDLPENIKRIVIVDDSIVRGTTLKSSVLSLLDSYGVEEIIVVSCAPQVRYPDFYGIDMSRLGELVAFKAAVNLLREAGKEKILHEVYEQSLLSLSGKQRTKNFVRKIYSEFSGKSISEEVAKIVTPDDCKAKIKVLYLWPEDMRRAIPRHTGDWCFSGNYPTSGAYTKICQAYVNWYEGNNER